MVRGMHFPIAVPHPVVRFYRPCSRCRDCRPYFTMRHRAQHGMCASIRSFPLERSRAASYRTASIQSPNHNNAVVDVWQSAHGINIGSKYVIPDIAGGHLICSLYIIHRYGTSGCIAPNPRRRRTFVCAASRDASS